MKKFILLAAAAATLALAACANTPVANTTTAAPASTASQAEANTVAAQYRSCVLFQAAQATIAQKVATLPTASAQTLLESSDQAAKLCSTVFTNDVTAASALTQALTTITALTAINLTQ